MVLVDVARYENIDDQDLNVNSVLQVVNFENYPQELRTKNYELRTMN